MGTGLSRELAAGHFAPFLPSNRWDEVVGKNLGQGAWVQIDVWLEQLI